ncbi:hypothetical protein QF000_000546 [Paraburkholderia atlantica]
MLKHNAATRSDGRCRHPRRIRGMIRCPIGLDIDNNRQHGLRLRILDQQALRVQFAPCPDPNWR